MNTHKTNIGRWTASLVALFVSILIAGCAVTPETRARSAPAAVALATGEGMLVVSIASNRSRVSNFFSKWDTLTLKELATEKSYRLHNRADSSASHSLFVDNLPSGTYRLLDTQNEMSGAITIRSNASLREVFPSFRIADGQLTDLGTIAYIRAHDPVDSGAYSWGQAESLLERGAVLRQLEPSLAARLDSHAVLGWDNDPLLQARREDFAELRTASMRAFSPASLPDGTLLFGESFGQIGIRSPAGQWSQLLTPVFTPINALHIDGDRIFAGSDNGALMSGGLGGGNWQLLPLPVNDASVLFVGPLPGSDDLLVVLQTRDRFIGLSTSRKTPGAWTEQFSRPRELFNRSDFDAHGIVYRAGERIFLATGSVESKQEVLAYDKDRRTWTLSALGGSGLPAGWASLPDGSLGRFRGMPLTGMYFAMSKDGGSTWEKRGELNWTNGPLLFTSEQIGYVVRTDSIPAMDASKFVMSVWRTDDAGRSWNRVSTAPAIAYRLVAMGGPDNVGFVSGNGKFFSTVDGGKTWQREREVP